MIKDPQKILFVSLTNYMGGAENVINTISDIHNSPVLFLKRVYDKCLPVHEKSQHLYLTTKPLVIGFLLLIKALHKYRKSYTIISSHPYLNAYLGILKRIGYLKGNLIVRESTSLFTRYSGLKRFSYKALYYLGYPSVNRVICQSELMRKELLEHNTFLNTDKALVLGNPIDVEHIYQLAEKSLPPEFSKQKYICAAGRLISLKGFDTLIESFSKISDKISDVNLLILGDGPELSNLKSLVSGLKLDGRVHFAGHVSNPYPYFKQASLCVVSSVLEGFPNVLLQMIALNNNVISTRCAGGIEDISFIKTVKVGCIDELAGSIESALCTNGSTVKPNQYVKNQFFQSRKPKFFLESALASL